eukprot:TRINITY_DN17132_c0_g1_i1.p1 TRINITY_DN17132_c0_g1~~TRINITY_DN17132_c0_g1_i1.p1  ORF type:complete len:1906 (+),score=679.93 TRINITY_DN17132_c0_g1_i1:84-5720(+)
MSACRMALAAVCGAAAVCGMEDAPDLLHVGGTLFDLQREKPGEAPTELDLILGGHTIIFTIGSHAARTQFKPELERDRSIADTFIDHLVAGIGEQTGFRSRVRNLVSWESISVSADGLTLTVTLLPDPEYNIRQPEQLWFAVHGAALDCDCPYVLGGAAPLTVMPMSLPPPTLSVPATVCAAQLHAVSGFGGRAQDKAAELATITWHTSFDSACQPDQCGWPAVVTSPSARDTVIELPPAAGVLQVNVTYRLRDAQRTTTATVRRALPPMPAVLRSEELHVAGAAARLNAVGQPKSLGWGQWLVIAGDVSLSDEAAEDAMLTGIVGEAELLWRVTSADSACEGTEAPLRVRAEEARVVDEPPAEICAESVRLEAAPVLLNLERSWSAADGVKFLPSAQAHAVTASGLHYGTNDLTWSLRGDGNSTSSKVVRVRRLRPPQAAIQWDGPEQLFFSRESQAVAAAAAEGQGTWNLSSTCSPPLALDHGGGRTAEIRGLGLLTEACEAELTWTVQNPPCDESQHTIVFSVTAEPPSAAEPGPDVTLCGDSAEALLSATVPAVGTGLWDVVSGGGRLQAAGSVRTALTGIPLGETIVRWSVQSADEVRASNLTVTRYRLPEAQIERPRGGLATVCGGSYTLKGNMSLVDDGDFGEWVVERGWEHVAVRQHARERETGTAHVSGLPPGDTTATWRVNTHLARPRCPDGNAATTSIRSIQMPAPDEVALLHSTSSAYNLTVTDALDAAIAHLPESRRQRFVSFRYSLAELPGEWEAADSGLRVAEPTAHRTLVEGLSKGRNRLQWRLADCPGEESAVLTVDINYEDRLTCTIRALGGVVGQKGWHYVVGNTAAVTATLPADSVGRWDSPTEGVSVEYRSGNVSVAQVSGLPDEGGVVTLTVTQGNPAFEGRCSLAVYALRAYVPHPRRHVCSDHITLRALPPLVAVPSLVMGWQTLPGSQLELSDASAADPIVSGLEPGNNVLKWVLSLGGEVDEAVVTVRRELVRTPFDADSLHVRRWAVASDSLVLPWRPDVPDWPQTPSGFAVPDGVTVSFGPRSETLIIGGLTPTPADVVIPITPPPGSACLSGKPIHFRLTAASTSLQVTADPIRDECELLAGAQLVLRAAADHIDFFGWRPQSQLAPNSSAVADLRVALGPRLGPALLSVTVHASGAALTLSFGPVSLRQRTAAEVEPFVLGSLVLPRSLWSSEVALPDVDVRCLFRVGGGLSKGFRVDPLQAEVRSGGADHLSETVLSAGGSDLELRLSSGTAGIAARLLASRAAQAEFLDSLVVQRSGCMDAAASCESTAGWDQRRQVLLDYDALPRVADDALVFRLRPDPHFAVSVWQDVGVVAPLHVVCGQPPPAGAAPRQLVSRPLQVDDVPCTLTPRGKIGECDFERSGATIDVVAEGCSFAAGAYLNASHFYSGRQGLPRGWDSVARDRGLFTSTCAEVGPKRRTVSIAPAGAVYEIPDTEKEVLHVRVPADLLVGHGLGVAEVESSVSELQVEPTFVSAVGGEVCADVLRTQGHTVVVRLHGDSWTATTPGWKHMIFGGIAGSGEDHRNGWRDSLRPFTPQGAKYVRLLSEHEVEIRIPPLSRYSPHILSETVPFALHQDATKCSKCLRAESLLRIYSSRAMVADAQSLARPGTDRLTLRLPCNVYSPPPSMPQLLRSVRSVGAPVEGGVVSRFPFLVLDVDSRPSAVTIHFDWGYRTDGNAGAESLDFRLGELQLVEPVVVSEWEEEPQDAAVWWVWSALAFVCPVVLGLGAVEVKGDCEDWCAEGKAARVALSAAVSRTFACRVLLPALAWVGVVPAAACRVLLLLHSVYAFGVANVGGVYVTGQLSFHPVMLTLKRQQRWTAALLLFGLYCGCWVQACNDWQAASSAG